MCPAINEDIEKAANTTGGICDLLRLKLAKGMTLKVLPKYYWNLPAKQISDEVRNVLRFVKTPTESTRKLGPGS